MCIHDFIWYRALNIYVMALHGVIACHRLASTLQGDRSSLITYIFITTKHPQCNRVILRLVIGIKFFALMSTLKTPKNKIMKSVEIKLCGKCRFLSNTKFNPLRANNREVTQLD